MLKWNVISLEGGTLETDSEHLRMLDEIFIHQTILTADLKTLRAIHTATSDPFWRSLIDIVEKHGNIKYGEAR